ncbi:V-type proton ATPase subunit a isoform 1 [Araneus ventricosus]|uniref:V-type proton ATPase subunit a n=1 Tax=Araneus ventricosus TaxID=182803 RepID=A0A4Y2T4C5_ARAVE|nr:V-type proton ATPase subunit a isoform 1 [Araneus ventricosus]
MGSLFRSESMALCQLFLQNESAYSAVSNLGELGLVQFRDTNPSVSAFQRRFVNQVRRCEEMERKLTYVESEIIKDEIPTQDLEQNPTAPQPKELIDLESTFEKLENELREVNSNSDALKKTYFELTELKNVLIQAHKFFADQETHPHHQVDTMDQTNLVTNEVSAAPAQHGFVTGVILRERILGFEMMLWRVCRGKVFLKQAELDTAIEDPITGAKLNKVVFILFFQGDQLKGRVKKICDGFHATLYPCPESYDERDKMLTGVKTRLEDLNQVLNQTQDHRHRLLVNAAKSIKVWLIKVRKVKAIYHTMNLFNQDVTKECLIAECWCSDKRMSEVQQALRDASEQSGSSVPSIVNRMETKESPPTYNILNKFTNGFQNIVDAYGVASYMEVNPAPYTIITFPFIFAVMFGDCGHGLLMALFAFWMILKERQFLAKKSDNEIWNTMFGGRYIIFLMGLFSIYTGLIYNDAFSKSINIFGSSWKIPQENISHGVKSVILNPVVSFNVSAPYPFGLDPFKVGNFNIEDEPRSGHPIEVGCEQLKQIIHQDRNVSTRTIVLELDVCQKTIVNAMKRINLTFKFNLWVPHELTSEDKRKRKAACLDLLRDQRKEKVLDRIVTCDEKWCTTTIQAVKEGGQHLGNQQARLQDEP